MTKPEVITPEEIRDDQIVVATPHLAVVARLLQRYEVDIIRSEDSRDLGLTLLDLPGQQVERAAARNTAPGAPEQPLGRLLHGLYADSKKENGGWYPTVGKNRVVRQVMGAGHNIGGGGDCFPVNATGRLSRRPGEPGRGVRVGLPDTAIYAHPWLAGSFEAAPADIWADDEPDRYEGGHATFVAGLILRQAPGATLVVRSVLGPDLTAESWQVARELVRFARSGLDVLNLSFTCLTDDGAPSMVLSTAIDRIGPGVVVVAAAGNHGATDDRNRPGYPAGNPEVVGVSAVDEHGRRPAWSTATDRPWIDAVAPGSEVMSTFPHREFAMGPKGERRKFDGLATWSGTSFAAATVTGAIAARVIPGEVGAATAVRQLLDSAPRLSADGPAADDTSQPSIEKPWIR